MNKLSIPEGFVLSPIVRDGLNDGRPVVALESTIIAHGMPFPLNVQTATEVEKIISDAGAVPATIAVLNGNVHIGLDEQSLQTLGQASGVFKTTVRDLPYVMNGKLNGATTVAATIRLAAMAGIKIFVTGGIGGVHRGAESTMDVSSDLTEMSQTDVAVISAGVKSILDIGRTLEMLETLSIPVITYGSEEFPSFYSRQSGFNSPLKLDSAAAIAGLLFQKWSLGIHGSVLIANPVEKDKEVPFVKMELFIRDALDAARRMNVTGKSVTPFLLKYIAEKTGGESLEANIALVKNNARLGAQVAIEFQKLNK